ncbi:MAG: hypothetical protein Q7J44_15685 [Pseudotabrizicola sp.]|uniref:hypothetical protein n=1 Tax=Pseudotabrizicola sp. TaxID=2939647 RepID=UPI00271EEE5A|nr:hypothetical protein [Pseudotabrizicola sp.]MDO9639978.1 hypothetical protein [Pseudotabrizicola sp.]
MYELYLESLRQDGSLHDRIIGELAALQSSPVVARNSHLRGQYVIFARLINLRLPLPEGLLRLPEQSDDPLDGLADLPVPDSQAVAEAEADLAKDPCRPDLWLAVAAGHLRGGDPARAHQLLRRLAASGYPERAQAQAILARSVALAYRRAA